MYWNLERMILHLIYASVSFNISRTFCLSHLFFFHKNNWLLFVKLYFQYLSTVLLNNNGVEYSISTFFSLMTRLWRQYLKRKYCLYNNEVIRYLGGIYFRLAITASRAIDTTKPVIDKRWASRYDIKYNVIENDFKKSIGPLGGTSILNYLKDNHHHLHKFLLSTDFFSM